MFIKHEFIDIAVSSKFTKNVLITRVHSKQGKSDKILVKNGHFFIIVPFLIILMKIMMHLNSLKSNISSNTLFRTDLASIDRHAQYFQFVFEYQIFVFLLML